MVAAINKRKAITQLARAENQKVKNIWYTRIIRRRMRGRLWKTQRNTIEEIAW